MSHDNGGAGIQVFSSDMVDMLHNTVAHNSLTPALHPGELCVRSASQVPAHNNIAVRSGHSPLKGSGQGSPKTVAVVFEHMPSSPTDAGGASMPAVVGPHDRIADPLFHDDAARRLRLWPGSPALGSAAPLNLGAKRGRLLGSDLDGRARPSGGRQDHGACEHPP